MLRFPEASGGAERPTICIVTSELVGPFNNGGIGTSMTGLAICLAEAGFPVTILYTGGKFTSPAELDRWRGLYAGIGIAVDWIRHEEAARLAGPVAGCGFAAPWLVWLWLRDRRFDIVQFNDCMGEGFYCLAMKRLGAAFRGKAMFVALHSPSQWVFEINRTLPDSLLLSAFNHAERLSVRAADLLWSPSLYLLDWTRARGFAHPPATFLQKYVLPPVPLFGPPSEREPPPARQRVMPREIVFFGRLEERKGLRLFCQALRLIEPLLLERGVAITFLGKPGVVGNRPALDFLEQEARDWRFPWQMRTGLGQPEAVDLLRSGGRLAVIASPADNSPCTVYEALAFGIPFLAARAGGIPELIDSGDGEAVLFDYDPEALAGKLRGAIESGLLPARPAEDPAETRRRWIGGFEQWSDFAGNGGEREPARRLCVLVDGAEDADLAATLASLDGPEVARVLLIDRGWGEAGSAGAPGPVLLSPDRPDRLVEALGGSAAEAVLALRAGVVLRPGAALALVEALRTPAVDGLVPAATLNGAPMPPLGGHPSFCLFEGAAPGGGFAVKSERLARALEGGRPAPDAEHLALADLAVAAGLEIWPYPEPLLDHPAAPVAEGLSRRSPERIAAYAAASETERFYMAAIGYAGFAPGSGVGGMLRGVRERMVALGLGWAVGAATRMVPRRLLDRLRRSGGR
jgi:glycosyltransferase involved in cell wall biosynthesis